ncbi:uncharacterized protein LY89DRAFT_127521 [Mollisia scopiformis]|uniref:CFEM domain-containing protein n=1 Tax=Mollisia scopiformis TaxID=149040 RepID=A0A194X5B5_MOLSC|nr:uncharacterized protein LY89DRAFT_127521 [Mollisia scopiformis]KUJ15002.1 hypothetical protein LY89DRAFT_127521 [Mollisia scopiformis]
MWWNIFAQRAVTSVTSAPGATAVAGKSTAVVVSTSAAPSATSVEASTTASSVAPVATATESSIQSSSASEATSSSSSASQVLTSTTAPTSTGSPSIENIYPVCARACISPAISAIGCTADSATCQCSPSDATAFDNAVTPCVEAACNASDQFLAIEANDELCATWSLSSYTAALSTYSISFSTAGLGGFLTTAKTTSKAGAQQTGIGTGSTSNSGQLSTSTSGLSAGAKAGIGVGAALGGLIIIGLIVFAFVYGRRSAKPKPEPEAPSDVIPQVETDGKVELGDESKGGINTGVVELKGDIQPIYIRPLNEEEKAELESRRRAKELESKVRTEIVVVSPIATERYEIEGVERHELEALRREAGVRHELG